jgi:sugar lactone lactonase YvrE
MVNRSKRQFLKQGFKGLRVCGIGAVWSNLLVGCNYISADTGSQNLLPADKNGVQLPKGLSSRIIATSGQAVVKTAINDKAYLWHAAPDGGACFATADGGWIYVSNSEMSNTGGVGAIVFDRWGAAVDAYPILENTQRNCSGGATPWGSWLSCEEVNTGRVWECYPGGKTPAILRSALGVFNHEAVAVDEKNNLLYLTEDKPDGCLYRFTADSLITDSPAGKGYPDLSSGKLEVAVAKKEAASTQEKTLALEWLNIADPLAEQKPTRYQQSSAMRFNGGEGIAYHDGRIVFTTKGDNRVWSYDTGSLQLDILYDANDSLTPILTGVDNVTVSQDGDIYVAEDGGDLQIVVINKQGALYPIAQLQGHDHSEIAGLAFSPDGSRLYFSSQRGLSGFSEDGMTFEIRGF